MCIRDRGEVGCLVVFEHGVLVARPFAFEPAEAAVLAGAEDAFDGGEVLVLHFQHDVGHAEGAVGPMLCERSVEREKGRKLDGVGVAARPATRGLLRVVHLLRAVLGLPGGGRLVQQRSPVRRLSLIHI